MRCWFSTALDLIRKRTPASLEHRGANNALGILDTEPVLQFGMVADAYAIVVRFIRFLDAQSFDMGVAHAHTGPQ